MSTVDDAVGAGARALAAEGGGPGDSIHSWRCEHPDRYPGACECVPGVTVEVLRAAWPILSAGLRALHTAKVDHSTRWYDPGPLLRDVCQHCRRRYPCATIQELDRIDKELGL